MGDLLALDFMRQALLAALLAGIAAPLVGVFLVQRRMSLIGDGMGHVALAGVAVGILTGQAPVLTALVAAVIAGVAIELIRASGRTSGDIALAVMFYGGIALGVVLIARSGSGTPANLTAYLFGAILTTSSGDLVVLAVLTAVVLGVTLLLRQRFFAVANDEEYARAVGMPVLGYNLAARGAHRRHHRGVDARRRPAPHQRPDDHPERHRAAARPQLPLEHVVGRRASGWSRSVGGVLLSYQAETPSGGTIVLLAIAIFLVVSVAAVVRARGRRAAHARAERHDHEHGPQCGHEPVAHGDHVDYLHDGHRHAVARGALRRARPARGGGAR